MRIVTDASSNVIKALDFDSFGNIIQDTNPTFDMPLLFAGGLYDPDTGLVRFGFREYSPEIGRWTAKDPILFSGGDTDLYGYCLNDPVNLVDPHGQYVGVDDLVFSLGGALVGLGGQLVSDLISGEWSGWEDYVGAGLGGAAGGEALLYTGPIGAGAVGGSVTNLTKQGLKNLTGKQCGFDWGSLAIDTGIGGATGLIPGLKIPGATAGRGSYASLYRQMSKKLSNGTISSVSAQTASKMFIGRSIDTSMVPGAGAAAVAGIGANRFLPKMEPCECN